MTLDNGLEVILPGDHGVPLVAVQVQCKVGRGDDKVGRTGRARRRGIRTARRVVMAGLDRIREPVAPAELDKARLALHRLPLAPIVGRDLEAKPVPSPAALGVRDAGASS